MPIKYIGRTTYFKGKTLWEILGNLKDLGVGRYVVRNRFVERYSEPTYHKILKVETLPATKVENPHDNPRKVMALTEKIFRGVKAKGLVQLDSTSYKSDYLLIPKEEEHLLGAAVPAKEKILPKTMEFPPLVKELLLRQMKNQGKPITEPKLNIKYNFKNKFTLNRIAEDGETPDFEIKMTLQRRNDSKLYSNVKE
ncbi:uncharacterized protein LOC122508438 [Leptopilina heterotoma]|uniref:uncharacterized protein LOC122508438 n=1 Tax=Leptopilina heterotoma TaxID=63436 RepID=UPI001CA7FCDD|nr:uncharacterized protein LOC122508438 [Leptopilina heterotoma]